MIKVIVAIPKRADISDAQFHSHWREPHGRLALHIKPMRRYVQAHRIEGLQLGYDSGPYSGFAEVWLDDLPSALGLGQDPDYQKYLVPDEPNFCDVSGLKFLLTEEDIGLGGPPILRDDRSFKVLQLVSRSVACSAEQFNSRWATDGTDDAMVNRLGAIRHVRCRAAPGTEPAAGTGYDAVRELWWPDLASFEAARRRSPDAWRGLIESPIVNPAATIVVPIEEYRILWS